MAHHNVSIGLSRDEALVLFEWLAEYESKLVFGDHAEEIVIWRLQGQLESLLAEPFSPKYDELLTEARRRVRATE